MEHHARDVITACNELKLSQPTKVYPREDILQNALGGNELICMHVQYTSLSYKVFSNININITLASHQLQVSNNLRMYNNKNIHITLAYFGIKNP